MKKQKYIITGAAVLILGTLFVSSSFGFLGNEKYIKNNPASVWDSFLGFLGFDQTCTPQSIPSDSLVYIDDKKNTIDVTLPYDENLTSMCFAPGIKTFYSKAVVTPASGEPQDFTNPVTYTVKQDDFVKSYIVSLKMETPTSTPIISTCQELQKMQWDLSGSYELANDIDCSDTKNWNNGKGFIPIGSSMTPFAGDFDGKGKTISGLYINRPESDDVGLFGDVSGADIYSLGVTDLNITGQTRVGGLVGNILAVTDYVSNPTSKSGLIKEVYVSGNVYSNTDGGGLAGSNGMGNIISDSYSFVSVNYNPNISYAFYNGGLVGSNYGNIINSYSAGFVTNPSLGGYSSGGLVGNNGYNGLITNSYWDMETSGQIMSSGEGNGLTTSEMKNLSNNEMRMTPLFMGWNTDIWNFTSGEYPTLKNIVVVPSTCNSFTYSPWSTCTNNNQTRMITNSLPPLCSGGNPVISQSCVSCNSFTYSPWSTCVNKIQTRTVSTSLPSGCSGGNQPIISQSCVVPCSSFTYSPWSTCTNNNQTRTVSTSSPLGCGGGNPIISRSCSLACGDPSNASCWSDTVSAKSWGSNGILTGVKSLTNGTANTATLSGLTGSYPAADYCDGLEEGGYFDWYLPSRDQLTSGMTAYKKNSSFTNSTGDSFKEYVGYWSSTEFSDSEAWYVNSPYTGIYQSYGSKDYSLSVRCLR